MSKTIQLHIPSPCSEDWDNMTRNEQGRFCQSCQKAVIDFSQKTDKEILDFFAQKQKNICGRFAVNQTIRPLQESTVRPQSALLQRAASILLATTLSASVGQAQQCKTVPIEQQSSISQSQTINKAENESHLASDSSLVIKGSIVDKETNEEVIGASVFIKTKDTKGSKPIGTNSDLNGNFTLTIPYEYVDKHRFLYLAVAYVGYETQYIPLKIDFSKKGIPYLVGYAPNIKMKVELFESQALTGEVAIVKKRTFIDKVHDFFFSRREGIIYKDEIKK